MLPQKTEAAAKYDEILFYGIEAHVENSGSVDLTYTIDWKVLSDGSEGGVSWVKVSIPNENAEKFTALTDNIKSVAYFYDVGMQKNKGNIRQGRAEVSASEIKAGISNILNIYILVCHNILYNY